MRILIVKLSSLGDVVHSLPVVADLHAIVPGAQVHWLVEEGYADLLAQVRGMGKVLPAALRRWRKHPWRDRHAWWDCWRQLRAYHYDLVLDLQGLSKSACMQPLKALRLNCPHAGCWSVVYLCPIACMRSHVHACWWLVP
jgi:heptosyltransferase I